MYMKTKVSLMAAMVLMALCSCGEKKGVAAEQTVRVKVQEIRAEAVNGEQGFSRRQTVFHCRLPLLVPSSVSMSTRARWWAKVS